jgi:hypothetical protein
VVGAATPHGGQETKKRQEEARARYALQRLASMTFYLPPGPTFCSFYHLPIVYSNFESIIGLNHD